MLSSGWEERVVSPELCCAPSVGLCLAGMWTGLAGQWALTATSERERRCWCTTLTTLLTSPQPQPSSQHSFYLLSNTSWWEHQKPATGWMYTNTWEKETKGSILKARETSEWVCCFVHGCNVAPTSGLCLGATEHAQYKISKETRTFHYRVIVEYQGGKGAAL